MLSVSSSARKQNAYKHAWIASTVLLTAAGVDFTARQMLEPYGPPRWLPFAATCTVGVAEVLALREIRKKVADIDYQALLLGVFGGQAIVCGLKGIDCGNPFAYAVGSLVSALVAAAPILDP